MAWCWVATDAAIGQTSCESETLPTNGDRLAAQLDCTAGLEQEAAALVVDACSTTCQDLMTAAVRGECRHTVKCDVGDECQDAQHGIQVYPHTPPVTMP